MELDYLFFLWIYFFFFHFLTNNNLYKKLWNMLDYGMGKPFAKLNFQLIRYHKKIYIDPVTESLT